MWMMQNLGSDSVCWLSKSDFIQLEWNFGSPSKKIKLLLLVQKAPTMWSVKHFSFLIMALAAQMPNFFCSRQYSQHRPCVKINLQPIFPIIVLLYQAKIRKINYLRDNTSTNEGMKWMNHSVNKKLLVHTITSAGSALSVRWSDGGYTSANNIYSHFPLLFLNLAN